MRIHYFILGIAISLFQLVSTQENIVVSGNYRIRYCGSGPGSKAARLEARIPEYQRYLQEVLKDVRRGPDSKAFRAFFKTQANVATVERTFRKMALGIPAEIPVAGPRLRSPSILCLDKSIPRWQSLQAACALGAASIVRPQRELVILCQAFWEMGDKPLLSECPRVRRNRFSPNDSRVQYNMFGVFVHEFAHVYLANWDTKEDYNPQQCVELDAEKSVRHPQNYALYAASEFSTSLRKEARLQPSGT
ncbi:MAG: hypothetical protein Q9219_004384 [cf. Caloplaca sp. 3 TL-2023]